MYPKKQFFFTIIIIIFTIVSFIISGCASKQTKVILLADNNNNVGKVELKNEHGTSVITKAKEFVIMKQEAAPESPVKISQEKIEETFSEVIQAQPQPPAKFIIHFEQGTDILAKEDINIIDKTIKSIKKRKSTDISIAGHSDRQGNDESNVKLSLKRANKILQLIIEKGIDKSYINMSSHGEGNPVIPTEDGVAEPLNRRVEIIVR